MKNYPVFLLVIFTLFIKTAYSANEKYEKNPFVGTWKLISITRDTVPPSKKMLSFGEKPEGYLTSIMDKRILTG